MEEEARIFCLCNQKVHQSDDRYIRATATMGSINRLAIRGVRSFRPDDDEQVIEFDFPCTFIVGQNGCGK